MDTFRLKKLQLKVITQPGKTYKTAKTINLSWLPPDIISVIFCKTTDTFTSANNVFATFLIIGIYFANVLPKHHFLFDQVTGIDTDRQICLANGHQKSLNLLIIWLKIILQRRRILIACKHANKRQSIG